MSQSKSVLASLLIFCVSTSTSINPNCDFYQDVILGQQYFIYNSEYPNPYHPQTSCRWSARSPPGTVLVLSCNDIAIPYSDNCQTDRLSISLTGDSTFRNAGNYCGKRSFTILSQGNQMTIGLFSGQTTYGGTFLCSLAAMRVEPQGCSCSTQMGEDKIVGGQETKVNEFPWMATMLDVSNYEDFCGASLISNRYALTAAHCLLRQTPPNVLLLVGDHNLDTGSDTAAAAVYKISNFISHPRYDDRDKANDIAVIKTVQPIVFSPAVGRVCLPFRSGFRSFENNIVTVLGWGFTDISGYKSNTLQKVNLSVIANSACSQSLRQQVHSTQMCTYTPGKDSCISDSGGPLLWKGAQRRKFKLVGLVSFGISCATNTPGVNTRVTSFLAWIVAVTSDATYCIR